MALALAGCGGGDASRSAQDTAHAWVDAINEQDWERACELSVTEDDRLCEDALARNFRDTDGDMRVEDLRTEGEETTFAISTPLTRGEQEPPPEDGWTAYGPITLTVARHDGEHLVHFEVSVIR